VKDQFSDLAKADGWDEIDFHGNQAVLKNTTVLNVKK